MVDLQEIEAIKRLKYKYMRCIDEKRWDELAECFAEDATVSYSGDKYAFAGRDAIMKFLVDSMDRDSFNSGNWFNRLDFTYMWNNWGAGLPVASKNLDNWPFMAPLLANPALQVYVDVGIRPDL